MSNESQLATDIDPADVELPARLSDRAATVFDLETRPRTYAEWADGMAATFERDDHEQAIGVDDLCDVEDSAHTATVDGETTNFMCAEDPLLVGLLAEQPVTVESTPPNRAETVVIEFDRGQPIGVDPDGALLSLGIATDADAPTSNAPSAFYELTCPYGRAFPDDDAYEEWAAEADAVTDVLSVAVGIAVLSSLLEATGLESLA